MHIWWTLRSQRTCTLRSFTSIKDLLKPMLYFKILRCFRILRASNAPGFVAGGKGSNYHTQNECVLLHKSEWGAQEGGRKLELTWLESPGHFSGMSQSFTASLHTTPINSICRSAKLKTSVFTQLLPDTVQQWCKMLCTWQSLQQRPLLHLEPWVSVHLLQQAPPSLAHS